MRTLPAVAALLLAAACSPASTGNADPTPTPATRAEVPAAPPRPVTPAAPAPTQTPTTIPSAATLTLDGLGALRIGQPVPPASGWAVRGAQIDGADCRTVSAPRYPGVYAIVEGGTVRRISVGGTSTVRLAEGIGPRSTERAVRDAFPGFRESPHHYVEAPGKYLTAPGVADGAVGLRFEIGADRRVSIMHVGLAPTLSLVEGCA